MNRKIVLALFCACLAAYIFLPLELSAGDYGKAQIEAEFDVMKKFMFSTPINIACVFSAIFGIYKMFSTHSPTPLLVWGGGALLVKLIPPFINGLFT